MKAAIAGVHPARHETPAMGVNWVKETTSWLGILREQDMLSLTNLDASGSECEVWTDWKRRII